MSSAEDQRLGATLLAIRRRSGMTQRELATTANVPREDVMLIEAGHGGRVRLERIRRVFEAVDGRARLVPWWRGAAADRLLDERHAGLVERGVQVLHRWDWEAAVEATFSEFGERGSIDIFAARRVERAIAVCEVKGSLGSLEELNRSLDAKVRLAPKLAMERFGFRPVVVGRILILPEDRSIRRIVEAHHATMRTTFPARGREIRAWLRRPDGHLRGLWFLSGVANGDRESG